MTLSFLRTESAFKRASFDLLNAALSGRINGRITPENLHTFLLRQEPRWPSSDLILSGAESLKNYLNRLDGRPKLNRCQQALAHVFGGCEYQDLLRFWTTDLSKLFSDFERPKPESLSESIAVIHPFPAELQRLPVFASLGVAWETDNISTKDRAFMPPLPPPAVFGLKRFGDHEVYRSWHPAKKGEITNATLGVVLMDGAGTCAGAVHWYWWGWGFSGSDFTVVTRDAEGWLHVTMDIRPYEAMPSRGPILTRMSESDFEAEIHFIRQIGPYKEVEDDQ